MTAATISDLFARECAADSDIVGHLARFVDLVVALDAQHVIELGVRSGVSTIAFLYGLERTGGRLTSVDVSPPPTLAAVPGWSFIQSDDLAPDLLGALEPADIVLIDTSHHYQHTLAELEAYAPLVRPGGRVLLHDTELERPADAPVDDPAFPVRRAVDAFCHNHALAWVEHPGSWGLAEIVVP